MISIKYEAGSINFKSLEDLNEFLGLDQYSATILQRNIARGQGFRDLDITGITATVIPKEIECTEGLESQEIRDLKESLRTYKNLRVKAKRVVDGYDATDFSGRIETRVVTIARGELKRLDSEIQRINQRIENLRKYTRTNA